ncbi:uncharacterized protein METZ01_LOCUS386329, partial [marine metagenome]
MGLVNSSLNFFLPMLPRNFIRPFAMRYVAGDNEGDALGLVHELNQLDFSAALDILGEHSKSVEEAKMITESYIRLFEVIADSSLDCNISIKL